MADGTMRRMLTALIAIAAALAFMALGYVLAPRGPAPPSAKPAERGDVYTCSMHPQVRLPRPGRCPICFMDLIPVARTEGGDGRLVLSAAARERAGVETSPVERRELVMSVRMLGTIAYDETRLATVAAWVSGRIDKLYANYVGVRVARGDPLLYLYSSELRTAQEEFLIAHRRLQALGGPSGGGDAAAAARAIVESARKKLELWGILPAQIDELASHGSASDHMTIHAPASGTVIAREAYDGKYVMAGDRLFSIADLSVVWAVLDVYEQDLRGVRAGLRVTFEAEALPGERFEGNIAFVEPILTEATRTVKVRVEVANPGERLKPGMFVRAAAELPLGSSGEKLLSVPATAPLFTGARTVVFVESDDGDETAYAVRDITVGPRAGDRYMVVDGLTEGERVVTRGAFKIDAALQIREQPSLMGRAAPPTEGDAGEAVPNRYGPAPPDFDPVLTAYLDFEGALAADDAAKAAAALDAVRRAAAGAHGHGLAGEASHAFAAHAEALRRAIPARTPGDTKQLRDVLRAVSGPVGKLLTSFAHRRATSIFEVYCSMAFHDAGAIWFHGTDEIRNPYFGKEMLTCGAVRREFQPAGSEGK